MVAKATLTAVAIFALFLLLLLAAPVGAQSTPSLAEPTVTADPTLAALNREKLAQEVEQLKGQNVAWSIFLRNVAPILLPVVAVVAGAWRWIEDRKEERMKQAQLRADEHEKRDEDRFQGVVAGLGSDIMQAKIVAAVMLRTFLQQGYERFHIQAFDLVVGSLRCLPADDTSAEMLALKAALTITFKDSFPKARERWKYLHRGEKFDTSTRPLDATGVRLDKAFFYKVDLDGVFMPEASLAETDLTEASLSEAKLWRASSEGCQATRGDSCRRGPGRG